MVAAEVADRRFGPFSMASPLSLLRLALGVVLLLGANLAAGSWWSFLGGRGGSGGSASQHLAATAGDGPSHAECRDFVQQYLQRRSRAISAEQDPAKMLFFLHVPRTAGKT